MSIYLIEYCLNECVFSDVVNNHKTIIAAPNIRVAEDTFISAYPESQINKISTLYNDDGDYK